jgi:hypothetical protein
MTLLVIYVLPAFSACGEVFLDHLNVSFTCHSCSNSLDADKLHAQFRPPVPSAPMNRDTCPQACSSLLPAQRSPQFIPPWPWEYSIFSSVTPFYPVSFLCHNETSSSNPPWALDPQLNVLSTFPSQVSIVMLSNILKSGLGRKVFISAYNCCSSWREQEPRGRNCSRGHGGCSPWFTQFGFLYNLLPMSGTAHRIWDYPHASLIKKMPPQTGLQAMLRHFLNGGSFFPKGSGLCQVDKKTNKQTNKQKPACLVISTTHHLPCTPSLSPSALLLPSSTFLTPVWCFVLVLCQFSSWALDVYLSPSATLSSTANCQWL